MMNNIVNILVCFSLLLSSCRTTFLQEQTKGMNYEEEASFYYRLHTEEGRDRVAVGQEASIYYSLGSQEQVYISSYTSKEVSYVLIPEVGEDNFFTSALKLMGSGDSLEVVVEAQEIRSLLGDYSSKFEDDALVYFHFTVLEVKDKENVKEQILEEQQQAKRFKESLVKKIEQLKALYTKGDLAITSSGLGYYILSKGEGEPIDLGNTVRLHYISYSYSGAELEDSYQRSAPVKMKVGSSQIISGWSEGLKLVREGGQLILFVPPNLAYGQKGSEKQHEQEMLIFFIEILKVQK